MTQNLYEQLKYLLKCVWGLGLFFFVTLSLASFNPEDYPSYVVYNAQDTYNYCGVLGTQLAWWLFLVFGVPAYMVVVFLGYYAARLIAEYHVAHPYVRFTGACIFLLGGSAFFANMTPPQFFPLDFSFIFIGPGGFAGITLYTFFALAGPFCAKIMSILLLLLGAILYSDYFIPQMFSILYIYFKNKPRWIRRLGFPLEYILRGRSGWIPCVESNGSGSIAADSEEIMLPGQEHGLETVSCKSSIPEAGSKHKAGSECGAGSERGTGTECGTGSEHGTGTECGAGSEHGTGTECGTGPECGTGSEHDGVTEKSLPVSEKKEAPEDSVSKTESLSSDEAVKDKHKKLSEKESSEISITVPEVYKPAVEKYHPDLVGIDQDYVLPPLTLLTPGEEHDYSKIQEDSQARARELEEIISKFGYTIKVRSIQIGPVIAQYQIELAEGLRVSKIASLTDDLAVKLGVSNVRIVYPLLGKSNLVGIELPNLKKQWVRLREVMEELAGTYEKDRIPLFLGKDVAGRPMMTDLTQLPHLLIAGRTGTGKSVCLNSMIVSIIMTRSPKEVRLIMIDPKMVELSPYKTIPHLMHPVVTDMKKAEAILAWSVEKMEERYKWFMRAGVRHISTYNALSYEELINRIKPESEDERAAIPPRMPYIVIVADEMADLMMTAPKEVEGHIIRLAQKSRGVGIHLILATQKPTVDVITGLIKSNLPARIAFQVSSKTDSRVVLDANGADRLLGNGDMLFLRPAMELIRGQGTFLSDDEIMNVIRAVSTDEPEFEKDLLNLKVNMDATNIESMRKRDELYPQAVDIVIREKRGSISLLQRILGIGYGRAARLMDYMEEDGIVGPFRGPQQPREVLMTLEDWETAKRVSGGGVSYKVIPEKTESISDELQGQINVVKDHSECDYVSAEMLDEDGKYEEDEDDEDDHTILEDRWNEDDDEEE